MVHLHMRKKEINVAVCALELVRNADAVEASAPIDLYTVTGKTKTSIGTWPVC